MRDNSMLVKKNQSQTHHFNNVTVVDPISFENLGFKFIFNYDKLDVTLPEGWSIEDSADGFVIDVLDQNGIVHGKIECGNYPHRKGCMWLFE